MKDVESELRGATIFVLVRSLFIRKEEVEIKGGRILFRRIAWSYLNLRMRS